MRRRAALALVALCALGAIRVPEGGARLGDVVELEQRLELPAGSVELRALPWSEPADVERRAVTVEMEPSGSQGATSATVRAEIQVLAVDEVEVPAIELEAFGAGGALLGRVETAPERLAVERAVVAGEGAPEPAGLRPPAELPIRTSRLALLAAVALALLAAGIAAAVALLRRWRRPGAGEVAAVAVPAHEVALAALERLLAGGALRDGDARRFHIELAAILKRYLEERYRFPALERTTGELARELRPLDIEPDATRLTLDVLVGCDGVKFAGERPTLETMRTRVAKAREVVERTVPTPAPAPPGSEA